MLQSEQIHLEEWLWLFWQETNFYSFSLKSVNTGGVFKKQSNILDGIFIQKLLTAFTP